MSRELKIGGTGVALVTPFTDKGQLDMTSLEKMVNYVIEGGVEFIVALGTTAETPTLSSEEKKKIVQAIIKFNKNRLPLVLGMGGNNTRELVDQIKNEDFSDIAGILSVTPYYNKPTQEGIYQHFKAIAEVAPRPVILYNVPGRTSSNISAGTCVRLATDFSNIIAVKEASGNFDQVMEIIRTKPNNFQVLSGDDAITLPMLTLGGAGVISVIANAFPREFSQMVRLTLKNSVEEAREIHYKLLPHVSMMFEEGNPAGVKAYLAEKGIITDSVRLPLIKASAVLRKKISDSLS